MMYYLHRLSDHFIGFNVFFYVTFRAVAAAVMVRRFYPDRIVPHEGQGHPAAQGPGVPTGVPVAGQDSHGDGNGNAHPNGNGHGSAVRPLEGTGRER